MSIYKIRPGLLFGVKTKIKNLFTTTFPIYQSKVMAYITSKNTPTFNFKCALTGNIIQIYSEYTKAGNGWSFKARPLVTDEEQKSLATLLLIP